MVDFEHISSLSYNKLLKEEQNYQKKYQEIQDKCVSEGLSYEEFCTKAHEIKEYLFFIEKFIRKKTQPTVIYGKKWDGKIYELTEFTELCNNESITDIDGVGYYATINTKSDVKIIPSDVTNNILRDDFTHVIWFENEK